MPLYTNSNGPVLYVCSITVLIDYPTYDNQTRTKAPMAVEGPSFDGELHLRRTLHPVQTIQSERGIFAKLKCLTSDS